MALCGVTYTEFPDLAGLNSEITLVPIADLVPFHSRTDAGLRVKRLKELTSSAELVLVYHTVFSVQLSETTSCPLAFQNSFHTFPNCGKFEQI